MTTAPLPSTDHEVKCWPEYFEAVRDGRKPFDLRFDDRGYRVGDRLRLREWSPEKGYTGRELSESITYILAGPFFNPTHDKVTPGLASGWVILGFGVEELPW